MDEKIKITTKKAAEEERLQKEALEELKILCDARDAENKIFSELDEEMRSLTKEYNAGSYTDKTIKNVLEDFAILEDLHSEIVALELAETDSEHAEATRRIQDFFNENDVDAAELLNVWGLRPY